MIFKWYYELEVKFSDMQWGEMVVMPNHFHCIIEHTANLSVSLNAVKKDGEENPLSPILGKHVDPSQRSQSESNQPP